MVDDTEKLATFPRQKPGHADEELRIELCEFNGSRYVGIRLWFRSPQDGRFYPTKKGVSIRRGELADAIDALQEAERLIAVPSACRGMTSAPISAGASPERHR